MFVYLDNSATTRVCEEAARAAQSAMTETFGNPSSLHRLGLEAEKLLRRSRAVIADTLGARDEEIWFTSCGTESDNTAIAGVWESRRKTGKRVITTAVEHPAVLAPCRRLQELGADVIYLPVKRDGTFDMDAFREALTPDTILVSVMHVNNETGAVMPVAEIKQAMLEVGSSALLHTDAVQSYGKLKIDAGELGADLLSVSGHKIHAPKGIGALYVRKGVHIPPLILGGGQEKGRRSGTESLPLIAAFAAAAEKVCGDIPARAEAMRTAKNFLKARVLEYVPDAVVNSPEDSVCSVLNMSFPGCRGEVLLHMLEEKDIYVSTASACSSHSKEHRSHVLSAMGLSPELIDGALRFSFCAENTPEQMDYAAYELEKAVARQRRLMKAFKK